MKTAAIYIRVSTQNQQSDRQRTELITLAEKEGYNVFNIYEDVMSGFKSDEYRKELHQLKEDAKEHKFNVVLFSEFSRLNRKVTDLNINVDFFRSLNINLYFQKQNLWVRGKGDLGTEILLQVLAVVSAYEIELFAERSISGRIETIKNNNSNVSGSVTYGYSTDPKTKKLLIDEKEAEIIKQIFNMYVDGVKLQDLCNYLNSNKILSPKVKRLSDLQEFREEKGLIKNEYKKIEIETIVWTARTLYKILHNTIYIGKRQFKFHKPNIENKQAKEVLSEFETKDETIRIISDDLFFTVQEMLDNNKLNKNTAKKIPSLLKRLLKCGHCNHNYYTLIKNDKYVYACFGTKKDRKTYEKACDNSFTILQNKLDGIILDAVFKKIFVFKMINNDSNNKDRFEQLIHTNTIIIQNKEEEYNKLENKWLNYFDKAIENDIPSDRIKLYKTKIDESKIEYVNEITKMKKEILSWEKQIQLIENSKNINIDTIQEYYKPENHRMIKQLINDYIEKIELNSSENRKGLIHIFYKNGIEEMIMIKNSKPKNEDYLKNHIKTIMIDEEYNDFIENNTIEDEAIVYPYITMYDNTTEKKVIYDKERMLFIDRGIEYTVNEMYVKYMPKTLDEVHFYTKFEYKENSNEDNQSNI